MLKLLALNCTLKPKGESSTDRLIEEVIDAMGTAVSAQTIRIAALDIKPGVSADEGEGDEWPSVLAKIVACDVLLLGSPIWMGQPSSVVKRVLERLDAFLSETDDMNRTPAYGKVAAVVVVGNEDGAHHVSAELYQALVDVGFTIPAGGPAYWVGEAMGDVDYLDLDEIPENVAAATAVLARNTLHLATLLKKHPYPGYKT